jgi:hypothetical protein
MVLDVFSNLQDALSGAKDDGPVGPNDRTTMKRRTKTRKKTLAIRETCGPGCNVEAMFDVRQSLLISGSAGLKSTRAFPPVADKLSNADGTSHQLMKRS